MQVTELVTAEAHLNRSLHQTGEEEGGEGGVLSFKVVPRLRQIQNLLAGFIVCKFTY